MENHKKFTDFNTLGLFRSIVETTKLSLEEKLELRRVAVTAFAKTFEFLQLKDPHTYFKVRTLGEILTKADESQTWEEIKQNQQRIWASKRLGHRNFGTYSKHICGFDTCYLNGLMIRQGSHLEYGGPMHFHSDNFSWCKGTKAARRKKDRKSEHQITAQKILEE